ncbi:MAG: Ig-like domain-containing protein [Candidatus Thermoplasmatota archaeon]
MKTLLVGLILVSSCALVSSNENNESDLQNIKQIDETEVTGTGGGEDTTEGGEVYEEQEKAFETNPFGIKYTHLFDDWIKNVTKAKEEINLMKEMGVKYVEFVIRWDYIEPENDVWVWQTDNSLKEFLTELKANHIEPILIIQAQYWQDGKDWAVDGIDRKKCLIYNDTRNSYAPYYFINRVKQEPRECNLTDPSIFPEGTLDEYYEFLSNLLSYTKGYVYYYELENEPGAAGGKGIGEFLGNVYDYHQMIESAKNAIKAVDSNIKIINSHMNFIGGEPKEFPEFNLINLLELTGRTSHKDNFDIYSWHNNNWKNDYDNFPDTPIETIEEDISKMQEVFSNYNVNKAIFNTESAIQEGYMQELPKRWVLDTVNNVVFFSNFIFGKEERTDYGEIVQVYKTLAKKVAPLADVKKLSSSNLSRIYSYKITKQDKNIYLLWSEQNIANKLYGGSLVNFSSEKEPGQAENIIGNVSNYWASAKGNISNQYFVIKFDQAYEINKVVLMNRYKKNMSTSAQHFEIYYTQDSDWKTATWTKAETYYSYNKGLINVKNNSDIVEGDATSWEYSEISIGAKLEILEGANKGIYTIAEITNNTKIRLSEKITNGDETNLKYTIDNIKSNTLKRYWYNPDRGKEAPKNERPFVYLKEQPFYFENNQILKNVSYVKLVIKDNYGDPNFVTFGQFKAYKATNDIVDLSKEIYGDIIITNIYGNESVQRSTSVALGEEPVYIESAVVIPDTTKPTITITSPIDGATLTSKSVTVRGIALDNEAVQKVEISKDRKNWFLCNGTNSWSGSLSLNIGSNTIYAKATDTSGNTQNTTITVIVKTKPQPLGEITYWALATVIVVVVVIMITVTILLMIKKCSRKRRKMI